MGKISNMSATESSNVLVNANGRVAVLLYGKDIQRVGNRIIKRFSQRKWTCCCSVVWEKISNVSATESSNVLVNAQMDVLLFGCMGKISNVSATESSNVLVNANGRVAVCCMGKISNVSATEPSNVLVNGNGRVAVRLYGKDIQRVGNRILKRFSQRIWTCCCSVVWERYPTCRQPNHQTFARVLQNPAEHGSFGSTIISTPVNSQMDSMARISIAAAELPVFSNMSANPCCIGVGRAYMPVAAISKTSCDA
ncbi:hypothetical protein TNCV_3771051 [Trichonephila clavipes]|nr:hypothetical protein TNCV_3771051 [Trichonephila clavipes]